MKIVKKIFNLNEEEIDKMVKINNKLVESKINIAPLSGVFATKDSKKYAVIYTNNKEKHLENIPIKNEEEITMFNKVPMKKLVKFIMDLYLINCSGYSIDRRDSIYYNQRNGFSFIPYDFNGYKKSDFVLTLLNTILPLDFYSNDELKMLDLKKIEIAINIALKTFGFKDQDLFLINDYIFNLYSKSKSLV